MVRIICEGKEDKNILQKFHELTSPDKPYNFDHQNFEELTKILKHLFNTD